MDNKDFIAEAIQYQKSASDQVFEILSLYRRNSDNYILDAMDQFVWIPEESKERYQSWSDACDETTAYLKSLIDAGFEQIEEALGNATPAATIFGGEATAEKDQPVVTIKAKATETKKPVTKPTSTPRTAKVASSTTAAKTPVKPSAAAAKQSAVKTPAAKPTRGRKPAAATKPAAKTTTRAAKAKSTTTTAKTTATTAKTTAAATKTTAAASKATPAKTAGSTKSTTATK